MKKFSILSLGFFACAVLFFLAGGRINTTHSFPVGFYWVVNKPPEKGDLVLVCPLDSPVFDIAKQRGYISAGNCSRKYEMIIKKILAAKNDEVSISKNGVFVNGIFIQNSVPMDEDKSQRKMPVLDFSAILKADDVLLMSDVNRESFDSRYFGVMQKDRIVEVIQPIFTWS